MPDLWQLTLTTGHRRGSPRSEVADDVVAMLRPPIVRAGHGTIRDLMIGHGLPRSAGAPDFH